MTFRSELIDIWNNILRNKHAWIIINAAYEGICVDFERKKHTTVVVLLSNWPQVLRIVYDWPVKYYVLRFR